MTLAELYIQLFRAMIEQTADAESSHDQALTFVKEVRDTLGSQAFRSTTNAN